MENPTRRRVLAAGLTGTAPGPARRRVASASADTTEPTDASRRRRRRRRRRRPPRCRRSDRRRRHRAAQLRRGVELAARDLYQAASTPAPRTTCSRCCVDQPPGVRRRDRAASSATRSGAPRRRRSTTTSRAVRRRPTCRRSRRPAYELESTLVATHTELLGQLEGIDGAQADRLDPDVEARHCAVLADVGRQRRRLRRPVRRHRRRRSTAAERRLTMTADRPADDRATSVGRRQLLRDRRADRCRSAPLLAACGDDRREGRARAGSATPRRRPTSPKPSVNDVVLPAHGDVDRAHDRSTSTPRSPRAAR